MQTFFLLSFHLLFVILNGCTYLSKKIESLASQTRPNTTVKKNVSLIKNDYCSENSPYQYISPENLTSKLYREIKPHLLENGQTHFIEKILTILLFDAIKRPEMSLPYSRLQIYVKYKQKSYYYDFNSSNMGEFPYLKGIDYLAQKFLSQINIMTLAKKLSVFLPKRMEVSGQLESFLSEYKKDISNNDELNELFIKGDETLTKFESYPTFNLVDFIKNNLPSKNNAYNGIYFSEKLDKPYLSKGNDRIDCNIFINNELTSNPNEIEVLNEKFKRAHIAAYAEKENFFVATSTSELTLPISTSTPGFFIKAKAASTPMPFCEFKSTYNELILVSSSNNYPGQHLQHLIAYEINNIRSADQLQELLRFSRHLFLTGPDRILYESKRGRKGQLDLFLAMNFPIYHSESLGNIFGHGIFHVKAIPKQSLFIDQRSHSNLICGRE